MSDATVSVDRRYPVFSGARSKFGLLSETIQIKGALALRWIEGFPLRVDLPAVAERRDRLRTEARAIEPALVAFGFARVTPKTKQFKLSHKTLRKTLADYSRLKGLLPPYSDSGLVSLGYDFWSRELPKPSDFLLDNPGTATGLEQQLLVWLRYCKVHKLLATYLEPYGTNAEHYPTYWNLGARTGRVSCVRPNVQNIPKHGRDGIRELFVPREGRVLIEADFKAAELVALAQIFHLLYGRSTLGDAINAGLDPHIETAKKLVGEGWGALDEKARKRMRQAAKAVNFGLPGGLGAAKFRMYANKSYGLTLSDAEARDLRARALEASPELGAYLADSNSLEERFRLAASNLSMPLAGLIGALRAWRDEDSGIPHWRLAAGRLRKWMLGDDTWTIATPPGFNRKYDLFRATTAVATGRPRGRASYTEAHNTPFQGLVADGAKLALWNLYKAWSPEARWTPVAFVHDSVLIEVDDDPGLIGAAKEMIQQEMTYGLRAVCPDILVGVDVTPPLTRWGSPAKA